MAKSSKSKRQKAQKQVASRSSKPFFSRRQQLYLSLAALVALILIYFFPIAFQGMEPPASDNLAWKGAAQSILEAKEEYGGSPLWANNIFAGMPSYLISLSPPFEQPAKWLIDIGSSLFNWRVFYYTLGAVGMFLLLRFFNLPYVACMAGSLIFTWWPHLLGFIEAGHNTQFRAVMLAPFVVLTFLMLLEKPNVLNGSLFAISLSLNLLSNHYQITFYLLLILLAFGLKYLVQFIRQKQWSDIGKRLAFVVTAMALAGGSASFPTLLVSEYTQYSIRGGTGESDSKGLGFDYATNWSFHPAEITTFVIPRFFGGVSQERYEGDAVPQLRGQAIPGYWGDMPFTSSTHYMGVVTMFLVLLAFLAKYRDKRVLTLGIFVVFCFLLSFGKHFPILYHLFFDHLPLFNKFRVPSMILVAVNWAFAILAGFGLAALLSRENEEETQKLVKLSAIIFGVFVVLAAIPFLFNNSFSFMRPEEAQRFKPDILALLKSARYDLMKSDTIRMFLLAAVSFGLIFAFLRGKLSRPIFAGAILVLLVVDLISVNERFMQTLVRTDAIDQHFTETQTDVFLEKDPSHYRIFPLGELYDDNRWCYRHESIGGYHPAKLRIIQDVNESCLFQGTAPAFQNPQGLPLNWNVIKMLNVKYLLAKGRIDHPNLAQVYNDSQNQVSIYLLRETLPRIFFVGNTEVIADRQARLTRLNEASFSPSEQAILEEPLAATIAKPDSATFEITTYRPNLIEAQVSTDKQTLLVLSEMYYPAGWKAFVDGVETPILKANHILRSIVLPAGSHKVAWKLEPTTYSASIWIKGTALGIIYLLLIIALLPQAKLLLANRKSSSQRQARP